MSISKLSFVVTAAAVVLAAINVIILKCSFFSSSEFISLYFYSVGDNFGLVSADFIVDKKAAQNNENKQKRTKNYKSHQGKINNFLRRNAAGIILYLYFHSRKDAVGLLLLGYGKIAVGVIVNE